MKKIYEQALLIITLLYIIISPLYFNYANLFIKTNTVITVLKICWLASEIFITLGYITLYKDKIKKLKRLDFFILLFPFLYFIPIIFRNNIQNLYLNFEYIVVSLFISLHIIILHRLLNNQRITYLFKTLVLSGIISLLLSFLVQSNYDIQNMLGITSYFGDFYKSSVDRLYGTILYPNAYATFMLVGYFITFNYFLSKEKNNIIIHLCLFLLSLGFLLTMSKIISLVFIIINVIWFIFLISKKDKDSIFKMISFLSSIAIPILYTINKTRIFTYNNNLTIYLLVIIMMFLIYYLLFKFFSFLLTKNNILYTSMLLVILTILLITFIFPKNTNLKINNVISQSNLFPNDNIVFSDLMNLKNNTEYLVKVKINSQTQLHNPKINLRVLYINKNHIIKKIIQTYTLYEGEKTYYFYFTSRDKFEFYYFELEGVDIYNSLNISDIVAKNLATNKKEIYAVDNLLVPYTFIHSTTQEKYDKGSVEGRMGIYKRAFSISKKHFITGQGFKTFSYYTSSNKSNFKPTDEHSFFVRMLVELGLIGVIYYMIIILYGCINILRIFNYSKSKSAIIIFMLLVGASIFDINLSYEFLHFLLLLSLIILDYQYNNLKNKDKVMFISSAGGHLTELLAIENIFNKYDYILITEKNKISYNLREKYKVRYLLYGSRYYPVKYIFVSIINIFKDCYYFIKYNPDVIYTTGAHSAVLMCYLGYLFDRKIIFIEVFDRTNTPTLSGKLLYPIATTFIVQHDNYKKIYPKAKYIKGVY